MGANWNDAGKVKGLLSGDQTSHTKRVVSPQPSRQWPLGDAASINDDPSIIAMPGVGNDKAVIDPVAKGHGDTKPQARDIFFTRSQWKRAN